MALSREEAARVEDYAALSVLAVTAFADQSSSSSSSAQRVEQFLGRQRVE